MKRAIRKTYPWIVAGLLFVMLSCRPAGQWRRIDDGLSIGEFHTAALTPWRRISLFIVKIDPRKYQFQLLSVSEKRGAPLTAREWCEKYKLISVINAGMYQTDMTSNVGFLKNFNHRNNKHINASHKSLAVFNPVHADDPPFYIYDIDETDIDSVLQRYHTAIQNLRLIKRPGENRWRQQNEKWSEAALGQDKDGNVLFIYCRRPVSMHDFNRALLSLPIGVVCAQHLDGGPHASLYFARNGVVKSFIGAAQLTFARDEIISGVALPNVIGFRKRTQTTDER